MDESTKEAIKEAFYGGRLRVKSVDPITGDVSLSVVSDVVRHQSHHKCMVEVTTEAGRTVTATADHSLFAFTDAGISPVRTDSLTLNQSITVVSEGVVSGDNVHQLNDADHQEWTYDLCVPGHENFVLSNGILAHNTYSIGGISLDIEKSSKYESLKQNAESQFDKAVDAKTKTVKYIRSVQQPKYGMGVKSAFGSQLSSRGNILSPRSFI